LTAYCAQAEERQSITKLERPANELVEKNLVLWLKFDKRLSAPPEFADASGNDNHGFTGISGSWASQITSNGGGKQGEGLESKAYHWVQVPGKSLDLTGQVSVECWVKPSVDMGYKWSHSWSGLVTKGISGATDVYGLRFKGHTGELQFVIRDGGEPYVAAAKREWKEGTWYHIEGKYDGKTVRLYENGVELAKVEHTGHIDQTCEPLTIGTGFARNYGFPGVIDEVRIWGEKSKGQKDISRGDPGNKIKLYPHEAERSVSIQHPAFKGGLFGYVVPENVVDEDGLLYGHWDWAPVQWTGPDEKGTIGFRNELEHMVFSVSITPSDDSIEILQTVVNKTSKAWNHAFAFPCLSTQYVPQFQDFGMNRTYISTEGKGLLTTLEAFSMFEDEDDNDKKEICRMVKPTFGKHWFVDQYLSSVLKANAPYIFIVSKDKRWVAAMATQEAAMLFNRSANSCIHACPYFGQIKPYEEKTVVSRIYILQGTAADLDNRYRQDFLLPK